MPARKFLFLSLVMLILAGCAAVPLADFSKLGPSDPVDRLLGKQQYLASLNQGQVSFVRDVQPIL